jgi:pimeloyl-CoA dehydrogenase large subunit
MDLRFTPEENAFRDEVRAFMTEKLPPALRTKLIEGRRLGKEDLVTWQRILNAKGWAVPHWPQEWGGTGWSTVQMYLFRDEMQQAPAPEPLPFGTNMLGPVLIAFGNEAQKKYFLPRIANLDDWWCQGFSEPGAGSDLASLKTSAKRANGHYIVNGQKTWTTLAQFADWIFCLVRTDTAVKKQEGISFLLIDMKTPGITVRPIQTIDGGHEVNEVFFDDVKVPAENLVGEENKGWNYAKFLLGNERTGIARVGASKARLRRLKELAALEQSGGKPLIADERFRAKIAAAEVELKALEMTELRVVAARSRNGDKPDPASSILKIKGSEIQQTITELLLEVIGPYALPDQVPHDESDRWNEPPVGPEWGGPLAPQYFNYRKTTIYGGSNEIQKNIIAKAILGL